MKKQRGKLKSLIIHENIQEVDRMIQDMESRGYEVTVVPDTEISLSQPVSRHYNLVLVSSGIRAATPIEFLKNMKSRPLTSLIPVIVLAKDDFSGENLCRMMQEGAAAVIPAGAPAAVVVELADDILQRSNLERLDPVTGLLTGPPLYNLLNSLCSAASFEWYFLAIKLLGLQTYNIAYGYDAGDDLLRDLGGLINDIVREQCEENDFAGRVRGPLFCLATKTRRIDGLCRNILIKSERLIRKYYSPFELSKGYITLDENGRSENYYLSEINIGALKIPPRWDRNIAYLTDISIELLEVVKKEESGYRILAP